MRWRPPLPPQHTLACAPFGREKSSTARFRTAEALRPVPRTHITKPSLARRERRLAPELSGAKARGRSGEICAQAQSEARRCGGGGVRDPPPRLSIALRRAAVALPGGVHLGHQPGASQQQPVEVCGRPGGPGVESAAALRGVQGRAQAGPRAPLRREAVEFQGRAGRGAGHDAAAQQRLHPLHALPRNVRHALLAAKARRRASSEDRGLHRRARPCRRCVGPGAEEQDVCEHAQSPDIDLRAVAAPAQHLRGHVGRRSEKALQLRRLRAAPAARHAEVAQLHDEPAADGRRQEVVGLYVPVHDAHGVARRDGREHVAEHGLQRPLGQVPHAL
mmetsp:Transcript_44247/g.123066  ORF Transcript_44247/g.123066 Transcript_44247/m.123066 type:complete len:333 (+) Transcript_44247:332-1330(+)